MIRDILLPAATFPDATSRVGLGYGLDLAGWLGARVCLLVQEVDIAPVHSALGEVLLGISKMAEEAERTSRDRANDVRDWAESTAQRLGIQIETSAMRCRPEAFADRLVGAARYHDLTAAVVDTIDPQRQAEIEAVIFGSGGPVLIIPPGEGATPFTPDQTRPITVVVAWDGSVSAARALRDAMPILARSETVSILTVTDDKAIDPQGVAGVGRLLRHHGVPARHVTETRGTASIGDTLQAAALNHDADLLVMGAYGHNRIREFILGGATRNVLDVPRLPVLLAH